MKPRRLRQRRTSKSNCSGSAYITCTAPKINITNLEDAAEEEAVELPDAVLEAVLPLPLAELLLLLPPVLSTPPDPSETLGAVVLDADCALDL